LHFSSPSMKETLLRVGALKVRNDPRTNSEHAMHSNTFDEISP
jgi:hypothetical protein